jgi:predicted HD superfamily hydrolase involved in NAD metabolism
VDNPKLLKIQNWVGTQVSPRRFKHIQGVVKTSEKLAAWYGLPIAKARLAAWLHDCAKELPKVEMRRWILKAKGRLDRQEQSMPALWHPQAGAAIAQLKWRIKDRRVLEAIRCHTIGSPEMAPLAQLVFVADFIEPGRKFLGIQQARKAAYQSLKEGVRAKAMMTIGFLMTKRMKVHSRLLETWNRFCEGGK